MSEMATSQEKKEWILFIDGKKWISENLEKGIEDSEYVMMGVEDPNEILGFSNKETFKKWADSKGVLQKYDQLMDGLSKARNIKYPTTSGEEEEMRKKLVKDFKDKNKRFCEILREQKIEPYEIEKIKELQKKYDFLHSAILFDSIHMLRSYILLPRSFHPKLSWYQFNDRTESCINFEYDTNWMILFRQTWFRGDFRIINWRSSDLGSFQRQASSAIIL